MNPHELIATWQREEQQPFTGWDFSYLDSRMVEEQAPWSYSSRAAELMRQASAVIDLDTGGGERFHLRANWPRKWWQPKSIPPTSGWPPNGLRPLGCKWWMFDSLMTTPCRLRLGSSTSF